MAETPSVRNAVQHSENVRNSLGLNYETVALSKAKLMSKHNWKTEGELPIYAGASSPVRTDDRFIHFFIHRRNSFSVFEDNWDSAHSGVLPMKST